MKSVGTAGEATGTVKMMGVQAPVVAGEGQRPERERNVDGAKSA